MIDLQATTSSAPTVDDYAAAARVRRRRFFLGGVLLAILCGVTFCGIGLDNILIPIVLLVLIMTPILLWRYPVFTLYLVFAAVCALETGPTSFADSLTDRVPFFWNINTIFQVYAHANVKAIPLNFLEVFIITAGVCSLVRSVYTSTTNLRVGPLFAPILIYMLFVFFGWVNGILTGGDFKISLQEVRSQFYFLLAYLMAVNIIRERRQVTTFLWIMVWTVGIKGILYTFRRYVTLHGLPLPDQGVGSHEEAFLFDSFGILLVALTLFGLQKRMRKVMWSLLPFVFLGNLATNRRAGTAALIVAVPILFLSCYQAMPQRRKLIATLGLSLIALGFVYYQAFKNSPSIIAQPARAIHSQFQPDQRDASSNEYRDAENADLYATIKSSPIIGYGYGKRMLHVAQIADISKQYDWWDIMTHNQVLWVWMRVGTFGFLAFWMMVSAILIYCGRIVASDDDDNERKALAIVGMCVISMLMIFGLLDLQFSNFRDMLFGGIWTGVVTALGLSLQLARLPEQSSAAGAPTTRELGRPVRL